jgi:hypothetical protein
MISGHRRLFGRNVASPTQAFILTLDQIDPLPIVCRSLEQATAHVMGWMATPRLLL